MSQANHDPYFELALGSSSDGFDCVTGWIQGDPTTFWKTFS